MALEIGPDDLILETSREIIREGEWLQVICRRRPRRASDIDEPLVVRVRLVAADAADQLHRPPLFEADLRPLGDDASTSEGILSTQGLSTGPYVVEAISDNPEEWAEREVLILSRHDYDAFWSEVADEESVDDRMIIQPEELLLALRECISERFLEQLRISDVRLDIGVAHLSADETLRVLPPIRRSLFQWIHAHVLAASLEKVFAGGIIRVSVAPLDRGLSTRVLLTSMTSGIGEDLPPFVEYLSRRLSEPVALKTLSEYEAEIQCLIKYEPSNRSTYGLPPPSKQTITLTVNGRRREDDVEPRLLLVHYLREIAGQTGTHIGCDTSQCGACTVLLDGRAVKSCSLFTVQVDGCEVTTIEGLALGGTLHPIQQAFWQEHGLQCGFCTPGFIMAAVQLLSDNHAPTDDEIVRGLEGNLCRCTGYANILKAVKTAAESMSGHGVALVVGNAISTGAGFTS